MAQVRQKVMTMHGPPTTHLIVVHPQLFLCLAKATLDGPATKCNAQQPPQRHAFFARHSIGHEVLPFPREHVASHDQAMPTAWQTPLPFAPKHGPRSEE